MRVSIIVGHSQRHQGATAVDGSREWSWQHPLAVDIVCRLRAAGHTARVHLRPSGAYDSAVKALAAEVNAFAPDAAIELHFNAFNGEFHGVECLHWPGRRASQLLARRVSTAIAEATAIGREHGLRNRGAKHQTHSWAKTPKRLHILADVQAPSIIVETHFGDNARDHRIATESMESGALGHAIASAVTA